MAENRMIPYIEMGGETLQLEEARRLIAAATSTAEQLKRDGGTTAVMHDDNGGALFDGMPMNATEWLALADQLAAALLEVEGS